MRRASLLAGAVAGWLGISQEGTAATMGGDLGKIRSELDAAWSEWAKAALITKWRQQNPREASKLDAYRAGGAVPVLSTATGKALVHETTAWLEAAVEEPPPPPPPPPPPSDATAFGYRPALPDGWTLVEGKTLAQSDYQGKSKIMFRNCTGGAWFTHPTSDLIFVDCDMRGGCGASGERISFYGCRFGQRVDGDGCQVRPDTSGGARPEDWLFQGCTIRDLTRSSGSTFHTDGIQFGGVFGAVVRHCYFDNVAVEMILCNGWNGKPENVLIEKSFFGFRPTPGGAPIHFSHPGSSGESHPWASTNCRAVDNYHDGAVASIELGTVGCSESGTRPRSEWPHTLRTDGWLAY